MWATLQRLWWVVPAALLAFAWPDMREWSVRTWVGFVLLVVIVLVVYGSCCVSGMCSRREEARDWEQEIARAHVAMGREEEEKEAA